MTTPAAAAFRCAGASVLRNEPIHGTASTVRGLLILEHPVPWGVDAVRVARLPDGLGLELGRRAAAAKVRVLLVRRPGRRPDPGHTTVFAAYADPHRPWLERGSLDDVHEVLDLDLAALRAGRSPGLERTDESVYCVCTHGRHDACCAEQGRPVAAALCRAHPEETWEVSHIGGDRFAGNMLVLPHGLYYGRLDPVTALAVARGHGSGQLDLDHLRGRSGLPMPVQAAEIALRRELGESRVDALRLRTRSTAADVTEAEFDVGGSSYTVRIRTTPDPERQQLTCKALRTNSAPRHETLSVSRTG